MTAPHPTKSCLTCGKSFTDRPHKLAKRKFCSPACNRNVGRGAENPNWRGGPVTLTCDHCGRPFQAPRYMAAVRRLCGGACQVAVASLAVGEASPRWNGGKVASKRRAYIKANGRPPKSVAPAVRICKKCGLPGVRKSCRYHHECSPRRVKKTAMSPCADCGRVRRVTLQGWRNSVRCRDCDRKNRVGEKNSNWKGGITPLHKKLRASDQYKAWRAAVFARDGYTCVWCGQVGGRLNADHIKPFSTHPDLRYEMSNGRTLCVPCHKRTDTYLAKARKAMGPGQLVMPFVEG